MNNKGYNGLISVLTTVRDGESLLKETLLSVYKQTYTNYEHIVIDDGSADNTWQVIEEFQKTHKDHKIRAIKTEGVGRAKALNMGVEASASDLIAIIDADDLWHKEKLKTQILFLDENKTIDVLGTEIQLFNENKVTPIELTVDGQVNLISMREMVSGCGVVHSSVLMKKEYCYYNENRTTQLDYDLWLRLISKGVKVANLSLVLTYKRVHENQIFQAKMGKKYRRNGFKLRASYLLKEGMYLILFKQTVKLLAGMLLPNAVIRKYQVEKRG